MTNETNFPGFDSSKSYIGTCQACGARQVVNNGHMVLHGYTRPGVGCVFGECFGQRHAPFELSCNVAKGFRAHLINTVIPACERWVADLDADRVETLTVRIPDGYMPRRGKWSPCDTKYRAVKISRGYVHEKSSENDYSQRGRTFDGFRLKALARAKAELADNQKDLQRVEYTIEHWTYRPEALLTRDEVNADKAAAKEAKENARALRDTWQRIWKGVGEAVRDHKDGYFWRADKHEAAFRALPAFPTNKERMAARKAS